MERTKRLKKFEYDQDSFNLVRDKLVTWGTLENVEIVAILKSTSGPRLLGVIRGDEYDRSLTWTSDGKCVGAQNSDMDLYIDESIELWFNLSISSDGLHILASEGYHSEKEALNNKSDVHFDTVSVRTAINYEYEHIKAPRITGVIYHYSSEAK